MDSSGHNSELYWCSDSTAKRRKKPSSSNYWSIEIDKEKTIPIKNPSTWSAVYKRYKEQEYDVIEIDGDKYYYIPPPEDFGEQEE